MSNIFDKIKKSQEKNKATKSPGKWGIFSMLMGEGYSLGGDKQSWTDPKDGQLYQWHSSEMPPQFNPRYNEAVRKGEIKFGRGESLEKNKKTNVDKPTTNITVDKPTTKTVETDSGVSIVKKDRGSTWSDAVKYQKEKGGPTMNELIARRKKVKKGSDEYNKIQNQINEAYNVKKRH
tara:strand:+ start:19 stop:549 length:531 start_codon:yes stop_codon:yes gene_type:complete